MIEIQSRQRLRRSRRFTEAGGPVRYRRDLRITGATPHPVGMETPATQGFLAAAPESHPSEAPAAVPATPPDSAAVSLEGKRIVICEDEGVTQLQLRRALTRAGLNVIGVAINGRQGLEIALRERPDIILMDIHMPIMDGLEAARRILETYSVCVVMLTAFSDEEYLNKAQAIGASGYILKPVTSDTLLPQLRKGYEAFLNRPH